jgi:hypothetical protein
MNVEIGAEAALFPEKEYLNGIFIAVRNETVSSWISASGQAPRVVNCLRHTAV